LSTLTFHGRYWKLPRAWNIFIQKAQFMATSVGYVLYLIYIMLKC